MTLFTTNNTLNEAALLEHFALSGRKAELRQFLKALTLCRSGQGKAVFLTGNEGIGKSMLLETFLKLAETGCDCRTVYLSVPAHLTPYRLFALIVQQILVLANRILENSLKEINHILQPLEMQWTRSDLLHMVSMLHLQESFENRGGMQEKELSKTIYAALPVFKRFSSSVKEQVEQLTQICYNPWLTLAVSLVNPLNPQVRSALSIIEQTSSGTQTMSENLLTSSVKYQSSIPDNMSQDYANPQDKEDEQYNYAEPIEMPSDVALPSLDELQKKLVDLFVFINNALRQGQSALVIAFDQWESIIDQAENLRNDIKEFMGDVLRKTVEQRDFRLMIVISCRSEAESYAVGGSLFNALRVKYLVPSLSLSTHQKILKDRLKTLDIASEENAIQEIVKICEGNPAWLHVFSKVIESDIRHSNLKTLDWTAYQERFSINSSKDLLELLYTRLQLPFVGEEAVFLKALSRMISLFSREPFKRSQALALLPDTENSAIFMERLLDALEQQGFIDAVESSSTDIVYRFYGPFLFSYLKQKTYPLQEDIPTPDKIVSLKKVLPLSIQSGELNQEKTQELISMASAMENPELVEFVESTLIDSLNEPELSLTIKSAIIESLGVIGTSAAIQSITQNLAHPEALLREKSCLQLISFAKRQEGPFASKLLLSQILPLCEDISLAVRSQAYRFISNCSDNNDQIIIYLFKGLESPDLSIRKSSLTGVIERKIKSAELLGILKNCLEHETEIELFRLILEGLRSFEREKTIPILVSYLKLHEQDMLWVETMTMLLHTDVKQAIPWISSLLQETQDINLKLSLVRLLGSYRIPDVETLLASFMQNHAELVFVQYPELGWMTVRSLGWTGSSKEVLDVLEAQQTLCTNDEILLQAIKTAIRQISERTGKAPALAATGSGQKRYIPRDILSDENRAQISKKEIQDKQKKLIDLVPATSLLEE